MTDAMGNVTHYGYDGIGNVLTDTDGLNHTVTYTYNQMDHGRAG
jgi:RHS Repeat